MRRTSTLRLTDEQLAEVRRRRAKKNPRYGLLADARKRFGLASGALQEGRRLAEGLVVDAERMRVDLDATRGLIFADAVAARLAPHLGREAAHALVEDAAERVHTTGGSLREVLAANAAIGSLGAGGDVEAAFDITPAVEAAAAWVDLADAEVRRTVERLSATRGVGPDGGVV